MILTCIAAIAMSAAAQKRSKTSESEIEFTRVEHNFGIVPEGGKKVSCTFEYTNTGDHPLVITRITTTCKCVEYNFSKKPVAPGGKGVIKITYNPKKQEGMFYKVIQVFTNTAEERHLLTVRGEVIE